MLFSCFTLERKSWLALPISFVFILFYTGEVLAQTCPPGYLPGDGNGDCTVDGIDYGIWYINYGTTGKSVSEGNYDEDTVGVVDGLDYGVWFINYGKDTSGPSGEWVSADIGTSYTGSTTVYSGSDVEVIGSGADIWGGSDGFRYVYQGATGDLEVEAKITQWNGASNSWSKGGIMVRGTLTPGSAHANLLLKGSGAGIKFQWRSSDGGGTNTLDGPSTYTLPVWLRLTKSDNVLAGYYSYDGSTWQQVGTSQNISLPSEYLYGMSVTSHDDGNFATARYNSIYMSGHIISVTPTITSSSTPTSSVTSSPTKTSTPTPSGPTPTFPPPPPPGNGVWISQQEILARSTSNSAWESMYSDARGSWGSPDVSNQDSNHDQYVLAGALVCARTGEYCDKTRQALLSAVGTEEGARWLAVGRNMLGYTIAADVMKNSGNLTGADLSTVSSWLANFLTRTLENNNTGVQEPLTPFLSGSNASAQEGAVYAAIAVYTNNNTKLNYVWNRFRLYSCDRANNPEQTINIRKGFDGGWSFTTDYNQACAVNPAGSAKGGHRIDGAIINDMVRGGGYTWPPGYTQYPWVGLEGYIPAALILYRAGFPSFQLKDQAVKRTHEYLCYLENNTATDWWQPSRAAEVKHLVKVVYGFNEPGCEVSYPTGKGRTFGYTDWTYPNGI
jgi:hypothetical protein